MTMTAVLMTTTTTMMMIKMMAMTGLLVSAALRCAWRPEKKPTFPARNDKQ